MGELSLDIPGSILDRSLWLWHCKKRFVFVYVLEAAAAQNFLRNRTTSCGGITERVPVIRNVERLKGPMFLVDRGTERSFENFERTFLSIFPNIDFSFLQKIKIVVLKPCLQIANVCTMCRRFENSIRNTDSRWKI